MEVLETLARVDAGVSWLRVLAAPDDQTGWSRCGDLIADPGRLVGWQRDVADAYGGGADDGMITGAGLVLDWYAGALTLPAAAIFHLERRVLDLAPERVHLLLAAGGAVTGVAVEPAEVAESDTDAGRASQLRHQVLAHADRLLAAYQPTTRIGRRQLWGAVTDALDVAFLTSGWVSGEPARAADDATLVLPRDDDRLVGGSTLYELEDARGRRHWTRRRYSCCFLYRAPGADACVTCPRVDDAERRRQAAGW